MTSSVADQASRLFHVFSELAREYQFRDRDCICCHGLSVTQCYTLDTLEREGPQPVGALAERQHLDISSMSRAVDQLVREKLAERVADAHDRRITRIRITRRGKSWVGKVRADFTAQYEGILLHLPAHSREPVITAITEMLHAFKSCKACVPANVKAAAGNRRPQTVSS